MILSLHPEFMAGGSASPGCCYFCHASKRHGDPGVVDFHLQVDVAVFDGTATDGWLQSCVACAEEIGRLVGMDSADKVEALRQELAHERHRREVAEEELDRAMTALDALRKAPAPRRKPPAEA